MEIITRVDIPIKAKGVSVLGIAYQEFKIRNEVIGPSGTTSLFAVNCSDSMIYLFLKTRDEYRFWRTVECEISYTKIWFMDKHRAWLTAFKNKI
jgi:hypothetical protein